MTISDRQNQTLTWARAIVTDPVFNHYLAAGCDACQLMLRQIRKVVAWAVTPEYADDNDHWAAAEVWIGLPIDVWRDKLRDSAVRGAWTIPLTTNALTPVDPSTYRPADWPKGVTGPASSTVTDQLIDEYLHGW